MKCVTINCTEKKAIIQVNFFFKVFISTKFAAPLLGNHHAYMDADMTPC